MKAKLILGLGTALVLGAVTAGATAAPNSGPPICSGSETAISGTYGNLSITGNRYVPNKTVLNVRGNLKIEGGACLDAFTLGTVHVRGNIFVERGAILALGCDPTAIGPAPPCNHDTTKDTVDGMVRAWSPLTMYLTADTIHGDLISTGGGPGVTLDPYVNFAIKDNVIGGAVKISGWQGAWFGFIRNVTRSSAMFHKILSANPDGNEVVTNTIAGNLVCTDNTPTMQIGDSGGSPNVVGGARIGVCP